MALIHYNDKNIIIDCGSTKSNIPFREMTSFLKYNGIKNIDLIFLSHMHSDHISGLEDIVNNIQVNAIVYSRSKEKSFAENEIEKLAINNNIRRIQVIKDDNIILGRNIKFNILTPFRGIIQDKDILNANSMVLDININNKRLLFMGDATINTEKLINIDKVDILKVGHHGSNTSSSLSFINKAYPSYSIISAKKAVYGHPSDEVIKRLNFSNTFITENIGGIKLKL